MLNSDSQSQPVIQIKPNEELRQKKGAQKPQNGDNKKNQILKISNNLLKSEQSEEEDQQSDIVLQENQEDGEKFCPHCHTLLTASQNQDHDKNLDCLKQQLIKLREDKQALRLLLKKIEENCIEKLEDLEKYSNKVLTGKNYQLTIYDYEINYKWDHFQLVNWPDGILLNCTQEEIDGQGNRKMQEIFVGRSIHVYKLGKSIISIKIEKMHSRQCVGYIDEPCKKGFFIQNDGTLYRFQDNIYEIIGKSSKFYFKEGDQIDFCYKPFDYQITFLNKTRNAYHIFLQRQVFALGDQFCMACCVESQGDQVKFLNNKSDQK